MTPFDWSAIKSQVDALLAEYSELAEDDVLRADMIEGSTDVHSVLAKLLDIEREAFSMEAGVGIRREALHARQKRYGRHAEGTRALILKIMQHAALRSVPLPEATLTVRAGSPRVIITDETMLPEELCSFDIRPNKAAIKERIVAGETVPGAVLSNSEPSLTIRVR